MQTQVTGCLLESKSKPAGYKKYDRLLIFLLMKNKIHLVEVVFFFEKSSHKKKKIIRNTTHIFFNYIDFLMNILLPIKSYL